MPFSIALKNLQDVSYTPVAPSASSFPTEAPNCGFFFVDLAIVLTLTYNVIIQKSQTINPVRCCHFPLLIGKLECDFERPAGGKVK